MRIIIVVSVAVNDITLHYYTNTNHFRLFAINVDRPDVLIVYI